MDWTRRCPNTLSNETQEERKLPEAVRVGITAMVSAAMVMKDGPADR
jgi:hypothetical protein